MPFEQTDENNPAHWFEFARERLRCADELWRTLGPTWTAIELLQEAVERFLKGYLVATGWRLRRTHDLQNLMHEAAQRDPRFTTYLPLARELTEEFSLCIIPAATSGRLARTMPNGVPPLLRSWD